MTLVHPTILSPLIKIDEFATENEHLYTHFVTRPMLLPNVPANWSGTVYTSALIRKMLRQTLSAARSAHIASVAPLQRQRVLLSDGGELFVVLLPTESPEQNCMLLLELNDRRAFYTGDFAECASVLRTSWCNTDQHIHLAYVDNRLAATGERSLPLSAACDAIRTILDQHPGHRIRLPLADIGCESLLAALAAPPYDFAIAVGTLRMFLLNRDGLVANFTHDKNRARIIVVIDQPTTLEAYRLYRRGRVVTVRLVQRQLLAAVADEPPPPPVYHKSMALYELNYTPHAPPADVHALVERLRPDIVHGIYAEQKGEHYTLLEERDRTAAAQPAYEVRKDHLLAVFGDEDSDDDDGDGDGDSGAVAVGSPAPTSTTSVAVAAATSTAAAATTTTTTTAATTKTSNVQSLQVSSSSSMDGSNSSWLQSASRNNSSVAAPFETSMDGCSQVSNSRQMRRRPPPKQRASDLRPEKRPRVVYDE